MKKLRRSGPAPLDSLDEAVRLVRTAPAGLLLSYYVGAAPFVLALLYFWADMSRGAFADVRCAPGALGLALLFLWMKTWQAVFATRMRERVASESPRPWTARRLGRVLTVQATLQPAGLVALPVAAVLAIPFPWLYAFFQNTTALADSADGVARSCAARAWHQARLWASPNHGALLILFLVWFLAWINVALALAAVPLLLKMLLGIESDFTLSFWTFFNSTFVAVSAGLTWLAVDPVVKTLYVMRCFRGEALASGEDLRAELRALRAHDSNSGAGMAAATRILLLVLSLWLFPSPRVAAEPADSTPHRAAVQGAPTASELDRAVDSVLARREYTWREPRERTAAEEASHQDWLTRAVNSVMKSLRELLESVGRAVERFFNWLNKRWLGRGAKSGDTSLLDWTAGFETLFWTMVVVATLLLVYYAARALRRAYGEKIVEAVPAAIVPDLRDENVGAEQLPEDDWLSLARDLASKGEFRLALRALYLASLAHLARRELIVLARSKSNREYERELARRARAVPQLKTLFAENVSAFDRVWYGRHQATAELLATVEANVAQLRAS